MEFVPSLAEYTAPLAELVISNLYAPEVNASGLCWRRIGALEAGTAAWAIGVLFCVPALRKWHSPQAAGPTYSFLSAVPLVGHQPGFFTRSSVASGTLVEPCFWGKARPQKTTTAKMLTKAGFMIPTRKSPDTRQGQRAALHFNNPSTSFCFTIQTF
jgi:hypothetical protein